MLAQHAPSARIAVLRALHLGDLLCAVPALRALRRASGCAHIALVGLPWARQFVDRFSHLIDEFIEFPGFPGLGERPCQVSALPAFFARMQERRFDLALQMHGDGRIANLVVALFGARRLAGYYLPGGYCPDAGNFLAYPTELPEVRRHLALMAQLGIPTAGEHLEFDVRPAERQAAATLLGCRSPAAYACVHPGARDERRRWPPALFAAVADGLAERGLAVVLTGTAREADLTAAVARAMRTPALDLAGRTDLGTLAALVAGARLLVANDTGVSHLAAALGTPSAIVFSHSEPARWAPLDGERHRVLSRPAGAGPVLKAIDALIASGETAGAR